MQSGEPPEAFICPISMDIMVSPVMILSTGQIYDNDALSKWFQGGGRSCPSTGLTLDFPLKLRPQIKLRSAIDDWAAENGQSLPPAVYGQPIAVKAPKPSKKEQRKILGKALKSVRKFLFAKQPYNCQLHG